jgi:hypothetical protein
MAKTLDRFEAEQSEIVQRLEAQLKEKDQILEGWKKDQGDLEVQLRAVTNHVMAIHPKPIVYSPKENVEWTEVVPVMQFTDWHIGERQMADEIEGINEYDYSVATKRVSDLVHRENRVIDRTRHSYKIKRCVVIETGDMISGDIHEELSRTNEFPVPMQVVKAAELFAQGVSALAQNFDHVKVEYLTADNHSRLTKKPQAKQQGVNSFNFLVGVIAEKLLSKHPNVEFEIHTEPQKVIPVLGRRYLTIHGHQIRGWAGVPWYGVERKVGKESTSRLSMIMEDPQRLERLGYHKIVAGHLHVPINSMYYSVGGSLSGTNSYDRDNGRYAPPSQPMWFVHPKYGEFGRIDFTL